MRLSHTKAIIFSGCTWLMIGSFLLIKGLLYSMKSDELYIALLLIFGGAILGFFKAHKILSMTVARVVRGIITQPSPIKLKDVYSTGYCMIILSMMCLGFLMRYLPIPNPIRGIVDTAVGTALITGAVLYFRLATSLKKDV